MEKAFLSDLLKSYKGKWVIAIFSLCLGVFLLLIIDRIMLTRQFIYGREMQWINHSANFLVNFIGDNLSANDTNDVKRILTSSVERPDIMVTSFMDDKRIVRYSSIPDLEGQPTPFIDSKKNIPINDIFYRTFPIIYNNTNWGFLQVGYSIKSIRQQINISLYRVFAFELFMFFGVLFFAWRITGKLLKPLYEMKDVANKISSGDFSIRIGITSPDIIGDLAHALNNMALQLGDLTGNLKKRIKEATGDLMASNDRLMKKTMDLEESNRKLKELDRLKSDFVSMVSHELKTPLTSIIGFSKTLLTLSLPPDLTKKYLGIIESEGKRLSRLIEEFLDITKIEAGQFVIKNEIIDIASLVREVIEPLSINPGPPLKTAVPSSLPSIHGDRERLKRVLINLIDNAVKYSAPEKEIVISSEESGDAIIVRVKDSGPGIAEKDRENLFNKFFRGSDPIAARTRGSGLGLAIAKGIIKAHNGAIWVESIVGQGATFCFRLPKTERSGLP